MPTQVFPPQADGHSGVPGPATPFFVLRVQRGGCGPTMSERKLSYVDRVQVLPADESVTFAAHAIAGSATESAGNMLVHSRLIDSVAAFTHHRDIDALDYSLVLSLAELTSARSVSLGRRLPEGTAQVASSVQCVRDAHGRYQVHALEPGTPDVTLALLQACIDRPQVRAEVRADGNQRLIVPMLRDGCALGALQVESAMPVDAMRPLVEGFARIYVNYTALLGESERDKLTGLYNRRTFDRHLQRLLRPEGTGADDCEQIAPRQVERRHALPSKRVWLAILDIDHFKHVNDTYGHLYGDEVILLLAQQMRECFRRSDVLFRFGGEEFVIMLDARAEAVVCSVLERFRRRVDEHVFPQVQHVTVSIGYAPITEHDYPATVLDRADKALYFAKEHGRNGVYSYESLTAQGLLGAAIAPGSIDLF